MKIWILNNTKFDDKNINSIEYFEKEFIPIISKYSNKNDIILHLGQIFKNSDNINTKLLNNVINLFNKISNILPIYFLTGYDDEFLKLLSTLKFNVISEPTTFSDNIKIIPRKYKILENINNEEIIFINSQIEQSLLKNRLYYCGFYDKRTEYKNIINVGSPYQFDKDASNGFYVVDNKNKKHKYFENKTIPIYDTIHITDIKQIDDLDAIFINNNKISIEIDKKLIDEKNIKIDFLLDKYNFKSIKYINDEVVNEKLIGSSLDINEIVLEKIKNTDNKELLKEFNNIMKIFNEKY